MLVLRRFAKRRSRCLTSVLGETKRRAEDEDKYDRFVKSGIVLADLQSLLKATTP